jgi:transcriptional antiterminator NusG
LPHNEEYTEEARWYVVHTYSGYENKVKANLEKMVENRNLQDQIIEVVVPMEEQLEIKDGKRKTTLKKVFPRYVLVKMYMNDDSWYVVRNIRGVTGFVGPGAKPIPLSDEEIVNMGIEQLEVVVDFEVGDTVKVTNGPLQDFIGVIEEINMEKHKVRVLVSMFGRETPAELEFTQIHKM